MTRRSRQLLWRSRRGKKLHAHTVRAQKSPGVFCCCAHWMYHVSLCAPWKFGGEFIATAVLHIKRTLDFIYSPMVNHPRNTTHISLVCCSVVTLFQIQPVCAASLSIWSRGLTFGTIEVGWIMVLERRITSSFAFCILPGPEAEWEFSLFTNK